jgi:hypothetical protein
VSDVDGVDRPRYLHDFHTADPGHHG